MAGSQKPGPQNPAANPQNIRDGTNSLQATPQPSTAGVWQGVEAAADGVYAVLSNRLSSLSYQGLSAFNLKWSLFAKYGDQASATAEEYFQHVIDQVKNAADWEALNKAAGPVIGAESFQAGVAVGFGEGLAGDVASLFGLLKMLVLAGIYERTQTPATLILDPMSAVMVIAVKCIPAFAAQTKAADDQLKKMLKDLFKIAKDPLRFIAMVGKNAWKGSMDDLDQLKTYANQNTLVSQFKAGEIAGRMLYQVIMAILMVVGAAEAVAKLAAEVPELLRVAGILGEGGDVEKLTALSEIDKTGGAAKAVEKGPEVIEDANFGKPKGAAPKPDTDAPKLPLDEEKPPPPPPPSTPINITNAGMKHVLERHVAGGVKSAGKSLFGGGENEVKSLIEKAASTTPSAQANGNFERVVDAGRTIGVDRATGAPTSTYTVITNASGDLVTAFPGRP